MSRPVEEALNTVQGLKEVTSTSLEGSSLVRVQLNLGVNVAEAQQDVQAKVARIRRQLPRDMEDPVILRFDPNERPIMSIALQSTELPVRELTDLADEVVSTRLEAIPGVGGVNVVGGAQREIKVLLDPGSMRSYAISPAQVIAALERENQEVPAGRIRRGDTERLVRVTGRIENPAAFADVAVSVRDGVPIRVRDVGNVVDGTAERRSAAFMSDRPSVALDILKIAGSNTVDVADRVRATAAEIERQLPPHVNLTVIRDDSRRIRQSLDAVQHELVLGAVLTILVIYLFLNSWRSTVITGLALPISIISAFFVMWVFDFTVNTMTLLALALSIGLLIDDAIVVRENIVRHLEMGKDHHSAAREGTSEIGLAVTSTTLAVMAVFIPVAFMGGMIGKIFFQFGVTVAFAVLVSLFVSFTLDPMLSSVWPDPEVERRHRGLGNAATLGISPVSADTHGSAPKRRLGRNPITRFATSFNNGFESIAGRYPHWLAWALGHRGKVLAGALLSIGISFVILPRLGFTWMPDFDGSEFNVRFRAPPGSRLEYSIEKGREVDRFLRGQPEVDYTYMSIGGGFRGTPSGGQIYVRLKDKGERERSQEDIQTALRDALPRIPGVRATITGTPTIFGGYGQPIVVNVQGPEPTRLRMTADRVLATMRGVEGVAEPNSAQDDDIPQLDVQVDRQHAWSAGLGIGSIATTLQSLFTGQRATQWEDAQGYSHDVMVVYPDSVRSSAADVAEIPIASANTDPRTGEPAMVALSQVADVRAGVGPQAIERRSLERQISISTGVLPGHNLGDVARRVLAAIDSAGLPPGYRTVFTGDVQNLEETKGYVLAALLLAVVFIYLILASLFGSFFQPLAIMLALPLSFLGVSLSLWMTGGNLNVMTMIGIVMLMGLVTKNGILLIDFVNHERAQGTDRMRAILTSARVRLRPIIMTTVAMIFGMLPLALALGEGSEQRAPMAHAVIGELITSTLLTLFVVPVVYTLLDDAIVWVRRGRSLSGRTMHPEPAPEPAAGD